MNEALTCFQKANEELHTKASLKSWLFAVYMSKGQDAYEQMCTERKVDAETKREMDRQITEAMQVELPRDLDELLRRGHGNIIKIPDFEQKEQKNYLTAKKNGTIIRPIRKNKYFETDEVEITLEAHSQRAREGGSRTESGSANGPRRVQGKAGNRLSIL